MSPPPKAAEHLPTLDGWRAVAILSVMLHHGADSLEAGLGHHVAPVAHLFREYGRIGVNVFFGISGFLICSRLLEEKRRHGRISLSAFYVRRVFRILPPLLAYLVVLGALGLLGVVPVPLGNWFSALFFYANYYADPSWYLGHFWSLAVEEHFYLIWPGLLVLAGTRRAAWASAGLAMAIGSWRTVDLLFHVVPASGPSAWSRTDTQMDGLLWGCFFAILFSNAAWRHRLGEALRGWRLTALAFAIVAAVLLDWHWMWLGLEVRAGLAFAIPLLLVGTVQHWESWLGRILELAPLQWVGRLSYSLYLWQQLFLAWTPMRAPPLGWLQDFPFNFLGAFAGAMASYYLMEKPLVALGGRISRALRQRPAAPLQVSPIGEG